ncbi:phosphotriesterase family protein [Streptomyces luteolus]|uniref:Phosphotriesterase n=1 Tax=Streptomyces luteolus TaxID=3043615 RepID=A0ABT6SZ22_9ACTN|nr:phosphotriesterase [Streptomyces sp. B-S-A12]MDI3420857.1 phosphotriesterase [Streptomyces sp. B-S-A12]
MTGAVRPLLRTVLGPLSPADVRGPVLPHEHLAVDLDRAGDRAAVLDPATHGPYVAAELAALRAEFGLGLVVELSCRGMGRDPRALARISIAARVPVVAATGWYYEPFHPPEVGGRDVEELTRVLLQEIDEEIGTGPDGTRADETRPGPDPTPRRGTRVRPGVIGEVGSHGDSPSPAEARCLRAAAAAARARGLSVATHARLGRGGLAQLELLTGAGLDPHRVAIGHQDLLDEPSVHRELAAAGAYVAFDTVGKERYRSDSDRLRLLLALLDAGHADRALLSCDISRHAYLESAGGHGYGHLFRCFLGRVRAAGVGEELIDLMTRRNPLRFLTGGTGDPTP